MDLGLVLLRLAHVVAGISWAGGVFLMIFVVNRTARLSGVQGQEFVSRVMTIGRGAKYFELLSITTVVAGVLLYWRASAGLQVGWVTSPTGLAFTAGAIAAIVSLVLGGAVVGPTTSRMAAIGAAVASAGGAPTAEQATTLERLGRRMQLFTWADLVLIGIAVLTMATARYL